MQFLHTLKLTKEEQFGNDTLNFKPNSLLLGSERDSNKVGHSHLRTLQDKIAKDSWHIPSR
jgi:hypothetical protein